MARPLSLSEIDEYGHDLEGGEWQALRSELVTLLDQVDGRYSPDAADGAYHSLAQRLKYLRYQAAEMPSPNRHSEALASVKRAVDRFGDRTDASPSRANPQDTLRAAISEIRSRQAGGPISVAPANPQVDRLVEAVFALSGRLERLEGEIKAQVPGSGEVKTIADQVNQLAQVVELLAGAVGETGQVKRLESQIANLASSIAAGQKADVSALTLRIEDVAATVDRLVEMQQAEAKAAAPAKQDALAKGMANIEESVRNIYDRIDAIEKHNEVAPPEIQRLTDEMATFIEEMRAAGDATKPVQLLARVDALNARLEDIESQDGLVGALRADVDALRIAIVDAFEPRFVAIERQLGTIQDRLKKPEPADATSQIEGQIRQLIARMDETGAQLANLSELYTQIEARPEPDFEALASLVAQKTSAAFAKSRSQTKNATIGDNVLAELEKRMTKLFEAAHHDKNGEEFAGVQNGIRRVDERLARLEAQLAATPNGFKPPAASPDEAITSSPARAASPRPGDTMPANPGEDAPLLDKGFADAGSVRSALDAKLAAGPADAASSLERLIKHQEPAKPALSPKAAFDPNSAVMPPRPQSSLDISARDGFTVDAPLHTSEAAQPTEPAPVESSANANTFIAAHRRMAQRKSEEQAQETGNSLLGRAFSGIKASQQAKKAAAAEAAAIGRSQAPALQEQTPLEPAIELDDVEEDEAEPKQSFLLRHRQPILLAATLVAIGFLALNLINQRMGEATIPEAEPVIEQPVEAAEPAEPVSDISDAQDAAGTVRAIPGTVPEQAIDSVAVGSIGPMAAMGFSKANAPVAAMPETLAFSKPQPEAVPPAATIEPAMEDGPAGLDVVSTAAIPAIPAVLNPNGNVPEANTEPSPSEPLVSSPVKVEMPPDALGPEALRQAAADGDARAQFEIAAIYTEGKAVPQDYEQALIWYERAAAQGFAPAQYRLGNLYEAGNGTKKDLEQARLWYQRAAEAGNRMSMHNLAALYASGALGKQDFASAAQWFEQAAERGMVDSQFNLGMLYARGLGVSQDLEASYKWFSLVARAGDKDAITAREDVAKSLDAGAVTRLQAEVEAWTATDIDLAANFAPIGTWSVDFDPGKPIDNKQVIGKVQAALGKLGFDIGTPDGLVGPKTAQAIRAFEKATGMSETGAINPRLLAVLGSQPV